MPPARRGNPRRGGELVEIEGGDGVGRSIVIIASALLRGAVLASHRRRIAARGRQGRAHDVADVTQRLAQLLDQVRILAALLLVVDALLCQLRLNPRAALKELIHVQHELLVGRLRLLAHLVAFLQLPHHLIMRQYLEVHVLGQMSVMPRRVGLDRLGAGSARARNPHSPTPHGDESVYRSPR